MMKFLLWLFLAYTTVFLSWALSPTCQALDRFAEESTILDNDKKNIIKESFSQDDGQIRSGMYEFWKRIKGVFLWDKIEDGATAREKLLNVIKGIINFVLGFIGLVALIYLIYHGLMMLFNPGDDAKIEEGWKAIRYAAMAIIGVGVAWFIVSIIFQVIGIVIDATQ